MTLARNEHSVHLPCWVSPARRERKKTMKKELQRDQHLDECQDKLRDLMREYNCDIGWDSETKAVIMWDKDTCRFLTMTGPGMHRILNTVLTEKDT